MNDLIAKYSEADQRRKL